MNDERNNRPTPDDRETVHEPEPSSSGDISETVEETIGPYRLLQRIGEGGMGEVYLAEQTAPIRRRVAIKIIKPGMDSKRVVARFESERQALALMEHSCIAKVFEAGTTPAGRPYFVMEYVQGVPITEHCDRHRLNVRERLELFIKVCDGVQHAHQKAIIHRDIKPTNVLVTLHESQAVPKIIDFGVAKATSQRLTERTLFTELGQMIGTPEYMSPEQAEVTGQDIDTRTDVYSLGAVLYELLAGALPFDPAELRKAGLFEIQRKIREEDPPRPSTRVSTLRGESGEAAGRRGTEPVKLVAELRGDLDWITMKSLEKDRTRRYGSPRELARDIERYLKDEAVEATPPSAAYRAGKFVRRHRVGVAAVSVVATALIVFGAVMAAQAARIARERDRANREAATAAQVTDFLVGLFEVSDPGEARGNTITAREILDKGVARIHERLAGEPLTQARLMEAMGNVYSNLGLYESAKPLLEQTLEARRQALGDEAPETLSAKADLALLHYEGGQFEAAEQLADEAIAVQRRVLGDEHPDTLTSMRHLALAYHGQARYDEAEALYLKTLDARRRVSGAEHLDTRRTMNSLAALYQDQGRFEEADALYREALELYRRVEGEDHPGTLTLVHNLASLSIDQGRYDEAKDLAREAMAARRRVLGENHRYTLSSAYVLALAHLSKLEYKEAEEILIRNIEAARGSLGKEHPDTLENMNLLAELYREQERYDEAGALHREALDLRRRVLGEDHLRTQWSMYNLAMVYRSQGRFEEAEKLFRDTLDIELRVLGEKHRETIDTAYQLACLEALRGRSENAIDWLRQAIKYGYSDAGAMVEDPNLEALRGNRAFETLVDEIRGRAK